MFDIESVIFVVGTY